MPTNLTLEIITAAILGFEEQKRRINSQIAELQARLSGGPAATATPEAPTRKRKKFSAASRRKMAMAQKARWAKLRGESEPSAPAKAPKAKRRISEEGMKRIIAATKKRWRLQKAAAKAAAKKSAPARKKAAVKKTAVKTPAKKRAAKKAATASTPAVAQTGD
jgi:hypothetical protein